MWSASIGVCQLWNWKMHGETLKCLKKNLVTIPGKHSIDSLQKMAILGTSHIIWKILQSETWSLSGGDCRWFKKSTREKRPVTRDNIIIIIRHYWLRMAGALSDTIINLWVPSKAKNLLTKSATTCFSRSNVHGVSHQQSCFMGA